MNGQRGRILSWLLPEVAPKVGHNVVVHAFLHHEDFLLDDGKVISWKQRQREITQSHEQIIYIVFFSSFSAEGIVTFQAKCFSILEERPHINITGFKLVYSLTKCIVFMCGINCDFFLNKS